VPLKPFEAIVIGSGATGGVAAQTLAEAGVRVLVVETGPDLSAQEALGSEPVNSMRRSVVFSAVSTDNKHSIPATGNTIHCSMPMSGATPTPPQKISLFSGLKGAKLEEEV